MKQIVGHKFRSLFLVLCGAVFFAPQGINAQALGGWSPGQRPAEIAFIYHAEGREFVFSRQGRRTIFPSETVLAGAVMMNPSELVQTGPGASLEIQLVPSGTVIKLLENTSVVFNGIDINERFAEFGLLYGSVRVISGEAHLAGIDSVVVRSGGVSAQVFNGDMAVSYMQPGSWGLTLRPQFFVHTFRGRVTIIPHGMEGRQVAHFSGIQYLTSEAGETISIEISAEHTLVEREAIDSAVISHWTANNFAGSPPVPMPNTAIAVAHVLPPVAVPWQQPVIANHNRGKNLLLGVGFGLMLGSAGFLGVAGAIPPEESPVGDLARFNNFAAGIFGIGTIFTLIGILYNPTPTAPAR
jgi:hypothetical protein